MAAFNSPSIPLPSVVVVPNNETVGGTLSVTGAVLFSSNLGVSGTLGANGATNLFSTLNVTGATALASTLGVTGVTTVAAGSAAAPSVVSVTGTSDTGVFFPAADTVAASTAGSERLRIDSSGKVGIGTTTPTTELTVKSSGYGGLFMDRRSDAATVSGAVWFDTSTSGNPYIRAETGDLEIFTQATYNVSAGTERARITAAGYVLIGTANTNPISSRANGTAISPGFTTIRGANNMALGVDSTSGSNIAFYTDNGSTYVASGNIASSGSVTSYNVTSDYRLKQNVHPMLNALDRVSRLKPCTFEFIEGNQRSEGFIAHELQDVIPGAVTGEKDAIDDKGSPKHQSLDPSFIVATLTAAIQEQHALILGLMAKVEALEARG